MFWQVNPKGDSRAADSEADFRSGFVSLVSRPNAGKSTFLNLVCGKKVAATSKKSQTTRTQTRGIVNLENAQIVFVDTPGIHKPVSALGHSLNKSAVSALHDGDLTCFMLDALAPFGRGDMFIVEQLDRQKTFGVVNKVDRAKPHQVELQLLKLGELELLDYFPISARTGKGVDVLLDHIAQHLPAGSPLYGRDMVTDVPEAFWVAELVREELFRVLDEEIPYSVATQVIQWEWPRVRCEIYVERKSQKGIVIGKGGRVLKEVGERVRKQMAKGAYLELFVKVDKNWQRSSSAVQRYGYGNKAYGKDGYGS